MKEPQSTISRYEPLSIRTYPARLASGICCGLILPLSAALLYAAYVYIREDKLGVKVNYVTGVEQRSATMALWAFMGAFTVGFTLGLPRQFRNVGRALTRDRASLRPSRVLPLVGAGVVTIVALSAVGRVVLTGMDLYMQENSSTIVLFCLGTGALYGGWLWIWLMDRV
jgi:hypothetical protein